MKILAEPFLVFFDIHRVNIPETGPCNRHELLNAIYLPTLLPSSSHLLIVRTRVEKGIRSTCLTSASCYACFRDQLTAIACPCNPPDDIDTDAPESSAIAGSWDYTSWVIGFWLMKVDMVPCCADEHCCVCVDCVPKLLHCSDQSSTLMRLDYVHTDKSH